MVTYNVSTFDDAKDCAIKWVAIECVRPLPTIEDHSFVDLVRQLGRGVFRTDLNDRAHKWVSIECAHNSHDKLNVIVLSNRNSHCASFGPGYGLLVDFNNDQLSRMWFAITKIRPCYDKYQNPLFHRATCVNICRDALQSAIRRRQRFNNKWSVKAWTAVKSVMSKTFRLNRLLGGRMFC